MGGGPGEIQRGFPVILGVGDSTLFAHAPFDSKLLVFSQDLILQREENLATVLPSMGVFYAVADSLGIFVLSAPSADSTSFAQAYRIPRDGAPSRTSLTLGQYKELPQLEPFLRNPMLKVGALHTDGQGRVFWAHYYSSLRMGWSLDGTLLFIDFSPRRVEIPEAFIRERGGIEAGDPERATQSTLALTSDKHYLYALYSGEELTREKVMAHRSGVGKVDLRLGEGRMVDVFDKRDGSYRFSFELPVWTTNIAVDERYLYLLTIEGSPRLIVYAKPQMFVR